MKILHQEMPEVRFLQGTEALYFLFEVIIIVIVDAAIASLTSQFEQLQKFEKYLVQLGKISSPWMIMIYESAALIL